MNLRKIAAFALGPIGTAALGFVTLPIVTWYFSAEDVGRIAMLQVVVSFAVLVFSLGLDQAYVREYHESADKPALLKTVTLPACLLTFFLLVLLCLAKPAALSQWLFAVNDVHISALVMLCLFSALLARFLSLVLRMQEKGLAFSLSQLLPKLIFLLVIAGYVGWQAGFDLWHLVLAHTLALLATTLVFAWNTRREWFAALCQPLQIDKLREMLAFGLPLILGGAAYWGLTAMDKLFLRQFSTFEELGVYSVAASFAGAAAIFQSIFSTVWAPTVYRWAAEGINNDKIDQVTRYVLAVVVVLFSLAGMFSWLVSYFLPPQYERVQFILVACMGYPLLYTLSETTVVGIGIMKKSLLAMLASLIAALSNLLLCYALVPRFGAAGAASATAVAFWIFLVCRTEFSSRVWRPLPALPLYGVTLVLLAFAVATAFLQVAWMVWVWFAVLLVMVLRFREKLLMLLRERPWLARE